MYAVDAVKECAKRANVRTTNIGIEMGHDRAYVAKIATRNSVPRADTLARMLAVCGYKLCAVPNDKIEDYMLVID